LGEAGRSARDVRKDILQPPSMRDGVYENSANAVIVIRCNTGTHITFPLFMLALSIFSGILVVNTFYFIFIFNLYDIRYEFLRFGPNVFLLLRHRAMRDRCIVKLHSQIEIGLFVTLIISKVTVR
jgi:hypothetical protein